MAVNLNLILERGPSIGDERAKSGQRKLEIGAAALLAAGAVSAVAGGMMLYRAMRMDRDVRAGTTPRVASTGQGAPGDLVTEESQQSFPASDAPSWTPAAGATVDLSRRTH